MGHLSCFALFYFPARVLIVICVLLFFFSFTDSGGGGRPGSPIGERRSSGSGGSNSRLAEDTLAYTVQSNDTLTSLAARFDTTPSELVAINKLHSRLIFPGQVIDFIPPRLGGASHSASFKSPAQFFFFFFLSNEIWPGVRGKEIDESIQ